MFINFTDMWVTVILPQTIEYFMSTVILPRVLVPQYDVISVNKLNLKLSDL